MAGVGLNKPHFSTEEFQRPLYVFPRNFRGLIASEITQIFQRSILSRPVSTRYLASLGVSLQQGWSWLSYCGRGRQTGAFTVASQSTFHQLGKKPNSWKPWESLLCSAPASHHLHAMHVPKWEILAFGSPSIALVLLMGKVGLNTEQVLQLLTPKLCRFWQSCFVFLPNGNSL